MMDAPQTSRSSAGSGGNSGYLNGGSLANRSVVLPSEKARRQPSSVSIAIEPSHARSEQARRQPSSVTIAVEPPHSNSEQGAIRQHSATVAEVATDVRGDVLGRGKSVVLLSFQQSGGDKDRQIKVRGEIIGTFWEPFDVGPPLEGAGEVQVLVTYIDPSERNTPLMYPTRDTATFGDTENADNNVIKWRASLCKVGKKFS